MITSLPELFRQIHDRHGHYCPMSTLGGRLGLAALQSLQSLGVECEALTAVYQIDTCAVDGIAVATGCLPDEGRLVVRNVGRHRLELREACGTGVAVELSAAALEQAAACRRRLDAGEDAAEVLAGLRTVAVETLMVVTPLARSEAADA